MNAIHELTFEDRGTVVVARLVGEVDSSNAEDVGAALRARATRRTLVLDLSGTTYLDSAGIGVIDEARRMSTLRLVLPATSLVARALTITAMDKLIPTYTDLDRAVAGAPPP